MSTFPWLLEQMDCEARRLANIWHCILSNRHSLASTLQAVLRFVYQQYTRWILIGTWTSSNWNIFIKTTNRRPWTISPCFTLEFCCWNLFHSMVPMSQYAVPSVPSPVCPFLLTSRTLNVFLCQVTFRFKVRIRDLGGNKQRPYNSSYIYSTGSHAHGRRWTNLKMLHTRATSIEHSARVILFRNGCANGECLSLDLTSGLS